MVVLRPDRCYSSGRSIGERPGDAGTSAQGAEAARRNTDVVLRGQPTPPRNELTIRGNGSIAASCPIFQRRKGRLSVPESPSFGSTGPVSAAASIVFAATGPVSPPTGFRFVGASVVFVATSILSGTTGLAFVVTSTVCPATRIVFSATVLVCGHAVRVGAGLASEETREEARLPGLRLLDRERDLVALDAAAEGASVRTALREAVRRRALVDEDDAVSPRGESVAPPDRLGATRGLRAAERLVALELAAGFEDGPLLGDATGEDRAGARRDDTALRVEDAHRPVPPERERERTRARVRVDALERDRFRSEEHTS